MRSVVHGPGRRTPLLDTILRLPLMVLALSCLYAHTDSETSHYNWKLDVSQGKVVGVHPEEGVHTSPPAAANKRPDRGGENDSSLAKDKAKDSAERQEEMLEILLSTVPSSDGTWRKTWSTSRFCIRCQRQLGTNPDAGLGRNNRGVSMTSGDQDVQEDDLDDTLNSDLDLEVLDCGKPVNFTYYDHLVGIQDRVGHPHIPEPEVALTFRNSHYLVHSGKKKAKNSNNSEVRTAELQEKPVLLIFQQLPQNFVGVHFKDS